MKNGKTIDVEYGKGLYSQFVKLAQAHGVTHYGEGRSIQKWYDQLDTCLKK
jgi:hypothetical protein